MHLYVVFHLYPWFDMTFLSDFGLKAKRKKIDNQMVYKIKTQII